MFNQPMVIRPSYLLTSFLVFIHLGAAIIVSLFSAWFIAVPLIIFITCSLIKNLSCYALQLNKNAITEVWRNNSNEWMLKSTSGEILHATLKQNSYRSLYLVVLNFQVINKKHKLSVILLPDSLEKNSFRRLRAQLLMLRMN